MSTLRLRLLIVGLLLSGLCALPAAGQGGGLVIYENGSPDSGHSYAGAGARAEDAATAFQNPAGMSHLDGHQMILGTFAVLSDLELDLGGGTVSVPPGSTNGGGNIGTFAPGLGSFAVLKINDRFRVGMTVNALAANGVDYDTNWVGRSFVTENQFVVANIMPSLSFKVNDQLSIGAGINVAYMRLDQDFLLNSTPGAPTIQIDKADDWQIGGTFGVMFSPTEKLRLGLTYRTELDFELDGDIQVPAPVTVNFESDMTLAQGVNASAFWQVHDRVALLGDVGWSDWSAFGRIPTTVGPISTTIDRGWDDTWRIGLGVEWHVDQAKTWTLRSGFSYDSSPIDDDERLPDIPVGEQFRFSVGAQHDFGSGKVFSLSYTFMYTPMDVDNVALPGGIVLDGEYDPVYLHFFTASYSIKF